MHLRQMPYDRPTPPAPRSPRHTRSIVELAPHLFWLITMVIIAIGFAR